MKMAVIAAVGLLLMALAVYFTPRCKPGDVRSTIGSMLTGGCK